MEADAVTHSQPLGWVVGIQLKGQEGWYEQWRGVKSIMGKPQEKLFYFFVCDSG